MIALIEKKRLHVHAEIKKIAGFAWNLFHFTGHKGIRKGRTSNT